MNARQMSSTWTIGRHGVPSLLIRTLPVATAQAVRLFKTMSHRTRGDTPYAVALRSRTGLNSSDASVSSSSSALTFEIP